MSALSKRKFTTPAEAIQSLRHDSLGTVYYRATLVFVATAHGTGCFTLKAWEAAQGPKNSQVPDTPEVSTTTPEES